MSECNDAYVAIGGPEGVILIRFVGADTKNEMDGKYEGEDERREWSLKNRTVVTIMYKPIDPLYAYRGYSKIRETITILGAAPLELDWTSSSTKPHQGPEKCEKKETR